MLVAPRALSRPVLRNPLRRSQLSRPPVRLEPSPQPPLGWTEEGPGHGAPLLVAFGGMPDDDVTLPPFEFRGLRRRLAGPGDDRVHGLFLRDVRAAWFLDGVAGAASTLDGLVAWVRAQQDRLQPSRTVLLGNSSGAYAALAVGAQLPADEVLAFVPRSGLTDDVCAALGDDRLASRRRSALGRHAAPPDLPELIAQSFAARVAASGARPSFRTRLRVFSATDNAQDRGHAERLVGLPETAVSLYPRGDHQLAQVLRASGELDAVVAQALRVPLPLG